MPLASNAQISVVVPCYNAERWVGAAIESVLAQDWPVREVIVVDDGSSDRSADIVRTRFPHVTLIQQANAGVAAARNCGIEHSTGEWIAFIDADDFWLPGKLRAQCNLLQAHAGARMAYCAWHVWSDGDLYPASDLLQAMQHESVPEAPGPSGWIYADLLSSCHVWTSTVLVQRSLLDEVGAFDTSLRIGEDYDLWLRAARATPIVRVLRPLALYRMHPGSLTKAPPLANYRAIVVERALSRWGYASPDGSLAKAPVVDRAIARSWCDFSAAHLAGGNFGRARYGAFMSIGASWSHAAGWKLLLKSIAGSVFGGRS